MKRITMELGGHSPAIVCDDADVERAADMLAAQKFVNAGQVCVSPNRFYVQREGHLIVHGALHRLHQGDQGGTRVGRQILRWGRSRTNGGSPVMAEFVADALRSRRPRRGGRRSASVDAATSSRRLVITNPPDDSKVMTSEPFGPIHLACPLTT